MTGGSLAVIGGTLSFPNLTDFSFSSLQLSAGAALFLPVLTQGNVPLSNGTSATIQGTLVSLPADGTSGAVINVPSSQGLTVTLQNSGTLTGTTVNVGGGSTVILGGGTYIGTTTLNVGQGATVDLTGGQTTAYGGTLTGSGAGTVQLSGGAFYPAIGGVTLNIPGSMFQWTGGGMELSVGDVTNMGTINLSGPNQTQIFADGTLDDYGTIIQTGTGDFGLHSDNVRPTTLKIEAGGSYLMESDAGINDLSGTPDVIDNAGTIKKTAGTGTSAIGVGGPLTNTGTIEVDSGGLSLDVASITEVSGSTLTGGTWKALDSAALGLPLSTPITTNAATIAIDGAGAAINGIAVNGLTYLATNSGSFELTGGATLRASGRAAGVPFTNSGSLTLGAGSELTVAQSFTQTSTGTLNEQIGGTPASGQFGELAVEGTAALAGAFNASLVNGFGPSSGQDFPVVRYASATGTFARLDVVSPIFTVSFGATSFDLVDNGENAVDLGAAGVTAPTAATAGQAITVSWQATDQSSAAAAGNWQDSVYVSATPAITASSILLGTVQHGGGLARRLPTRQA